MRVLIISNIPTPYRCAFFSKLSSSLHDKGDELLVLFCAKNEKNRDWNPDKFKYGFNYIFLPHFTLTLFNIHFHFNFKFVKIIKLFNPTHSILAGSWNLPTNMFLLIFFRKLIGKCLFWSESHVYSTRNKLPIVNYLRKFFYSRFIYFLVPNNLSKEFVELNVQEVNKIFYLPNTVDQSIFKLTSDNTLALSQRFEFLNNKINVVQVSQLEQRKGVLELIESFIQLPLNFRNTFNLILVGNGPYKDIVQKKIEDVNNIFLIEYLTQTELSQLYKKCNFFVLSSFKDPNPLSPIEAVFSGKTIFVSKYLGNVNELIPHDLKHLHVFDPGSEFSEIFYTMSNLFVNSKDLKKVQIELYNNVSKNWDIKNVCSNLISDLSKI